MIKNDKILNLLEYRRVLFQKYRNRQITYSDLVAYSFQFLGQKKIRHVAKCHDFEGLYQNYLFWSIQIERKIANERGMTQFGANSPNILEQVLVPLVEKRDLMVKRLIIEIKIEVIHAHLVSNDIVEIKTNDFFLYCSKKMYDKYIKNPMLKIRPPIEPFYIPLIDHLYKPKKS